MSNEPVLDADDLEQLRAAGISVATARRQLALLRRPPAPIHLERPCTLDDGIVTLEAETAALEAECAAALAQRRLLRFVPASGAASRMFQSLLSAAGAAGAAARQRLLRELEHLPFRDALTWALARRGYRLEQLVVAGEASTLVDCLLADDGLGYANLPKGLLPFHQPPRGEPRSALEEHLREAVAVSGGRPAALHLTVTPAHRQRFGEALATLIPRLEAELGARITVELSQQSPATDTLALEGDGDVGRRADGRLLLRPGGHGALLENLERLDADLVLIKNIDNVLPTSRQHDSIRTQRLLIGCLHRLAVRQWQYLSRLQADASITPALLAEAAAFADSHFGRLPAPDPEGARMRWLRARLSRPLRVCGMVRASGEPGGGPFWVRNKRNEITPQIVEGAQVDRDDPEQQAVLRRATHFNPVLIVATRTDAGRQPYSLASFIDPDSAFVVDKSEGGQRLRCLEHPGLWNGAMAGWNSVFVEVPAHTFAPVKTVFDLLRPEHRW